VGIKPGDIITAVDGVSYSQMREGELALRIRGKIGSKVQLTLKRDDPAETIYIEVVRVDMSLLSFSASQPSPEPNDEASTPSPGERVEPDPSNQTGQSDDLDILNDILGVYYLADGYNARQVLPATFGLCAQIALLPNGDVALCNHNQSISLLSKGTVRSLVASRGIMTGVTALADGRVCYGKNDQILAIHPDDGTIELLGTIPTGEGASALATDKVGRVYATTHSNNLYRFNGDGSSAETITRLPFESSPTDIDIADNGDIYVTGPRLFVMVKPDGQSVILADDLQNDPVWCEIAPDGKIYVKDMFSGIRFFDSDTARLSPVELNVITGTSDFLAPSSDELLLVPFGSDIIISYNLADGTGRSIATNAVNSEAIAASRDGAVYLATPSIPGVNKSYFIRVYPDGTKEELTKFTFDKISSADVDQENHLCFYADDKFHRLENDGSLTSFSPVFPIGSHIDGTTKFAIGPDGSWYCITVNPFESTQLWRMDTNGKVAILPVSFDLAFFDDAYKLTDSRIDVGDDGRMAFIVTAVGSKGQGPSYQRVYRAEADGRNLTLIGTFDSSRIGVMPDIAVGPKNEVIVFTHQKDVGRFYETIYLIDNDGNTSRFLEMKAGRDPKGMDMDINGNVWLGTTVGLFYISLY
ncbi:MAG: PDZ domain-containing protein, partial [Dehalococcoidales bacterium]|nr:PDZ domain-containing protein [Dehalococcoidales bacterium]